jgi:stress-induced morphogen
MAASLLKYKSQLRVESEADNRSCQNFFEVVIKTDFFKNLHWICRTEIVINKIFSDFEEFMRLEH